jgi:hypothetical protein
MEYKDTKRIEDLNNGIITDLFPDALKEVLENIGDENTAAITKRKIVINITFSPSKDRETMTSSIEVKTTLAPPAISESMLFLSSDGYETTAHSRIDDPKQDNLPLSFPAAGGSK